MKRFVAGLFSAMLVAGACAGTGDSEADGIARTYAPELQVDLDNMTRSGTGLYTEDISVGEGAEVGSGQLALVHYTGWLPDGTEFDTSRDGDGPLPFTIGAGQVVPGWEEGVTGMRVGGRRKLVIPSHLAYGTQGIGPIPPDATLVFDVELVGIGGAEPVAPDSVPADSVPADTTAADTTDHSGH